MASEVKIESLLRQGAGSSLNMAATTQKLRALRGPEWTFVAENFTQLQRTVNWLEKALKATLNASHISIDSADIQNLVVGGEDGPGQLTILSGPPSYTRIGFDGTEETEITATISTAVDEIVTFTAEHPFKIGAILLIEGNTSQDHLGYWVVADAPTTTTVELADPPNGSGTGGTATYQYAGGWRRTFAIGGTDFETAPFFTDDQGNTYIGKNGSISILDTLSNTKGFLGVVIENPQTISSASSSGGKFSMTLPAHGYVTGDDVVVEGLGDFSVTRVDVDTFILDGSTYDPGYIPGDVYRYRGPLWGQNIAAGGTGHADAVFRTFRNGSVRIGVADALRFEYNAAEGRIYVTNDNEMLELNPTFIMLDVPTVPGKTALMTADSFSISYASSQANINASTLITGAYLTLMDSGGSVHTEINTEVGIVTSALDVTDKILTRTNLEVYSTAQVYTKAEVDALLLLKADLVHAHSATTTGTSGGGVPAHDHSITVT